MPHTSTHCGGGGEIEQLPEPPEFQATIHNHTRLNYAVGMKRWPNEPDQHWAKRKAKLEKLKLKTYKLAAMPGDEYYSHEPSYVHPEP